MLAPSERTRCVKMMRIAWTTLPDRASADQLAAAAVSAHLASCAQVEGPLSSHYVWAGVQEKSEEYRVVFKGMPTQIANLEAWVHARHPYQVPEWIVIETKHVSEKYLSWARSRLNP
jgi:periplasmic divalent cation tolerance protein